LAHIEPELQGGSITEWTRDLWMVYAG
jgi:hypothetical protein